MYRAMNLRNNFIPITLIIFSSPVHAVLQLARCPQDRVDASSLPSFILDALPNAQWTRDFLPHSVRLSTFRRFLRRVLSGHKSCLRLRVCPRIIPDIVGVCSKEIDSSSLYDTLRSKVNTGDGRPR